MVTAAIGALVGWAFSGGLIAAGIVTTAFGAIALGASLGSLFASHDSMDLSSSPNYSFGPISNTMSQLVPIYVIYGKCRVAGNIIYQAFDSDKKTSQDLYILVGEGGINSISSVMANDRNPAELEGCSVTTYTDTTAATHDSRDPSGARPYPDNVALICLTLKAQENLNGTPTITSIVEGMKVWTPSGFAYSRNPIWIILDILCHPRYGMGMGAVDSTGAYTHPSWDKIDYACALAAANYCDGTVEYGPRFQLDFVMDSSRPIRDVLTDFLAVCRGYIVQTNKLEIYIDAPVSTYSRSITPGNITENSFTFWQAADEDVCNRITVDWVDPDNNYERVTDVFQDSEDIAIRGVVEKSVSLLGVTRSGQVGHMGYYLLKSSMLVRNFCSFGVSFKDCDIQPGEVLTVSFEDFTGWVNKPFRVLSVKDNGNDVMTVTCSEYIPEIYDDSVMEVPVHIDTSLTTNYKPDDVEDLTITEQLETLQDGSYNLIAKITWTPPESYQTLELWYRYSSEVAWVAGGTLPKGSTEYYLPCTGNIGDTLYVRVYTVSRLGVRSSGQTTSRILHGDTVPPAAPTNLQGEGGFRLARLTWVDPPDGDLDHIDVYRSIMADIADDYEKIGTSQRFSLEYIDNTLSVLQTAWYKLKAVDVAGNESDFSAVISVTSEALPATEIPEASIDESKLLPSLAEKIQSVDDSSNAICLILNAIEEDKNASSRASIQQVSQIVRGKNGLVAQWYVKTDVNGRIAGFGHFNDGQVAEFAVLADRFFIAKADGTATPVFEVDSVTGLVQLIGSLIASGSLTGRELNAAAKMQLGAGGQFIAGDGSIVQIGTSEKILFLDSETGRIIVRNNSDVDEYVEITAGDVTTYKKVNGVVYPQKSLRQIYVDKVPNSDVPITIGGNTPVVWGSTPKIMVSPAELETYCYEYPVGTIRNMQNQKLVCEATNVYRNPITGHVSFIPRATLYILGNSGFSNAPSEPKSFIVNGYQGWGDTVKTLTSDSYIVPASAVNIRVKVKVYAQYDRYSGWDYASLVTVTITAQFNDNTYTICSNADIPLPGYNIPSISTEPTSRYVEFSYTLPGGAPQDTPITIQAEFQTNGQQAQNVHPEGRVVNGGWMRFDSISYDFAAGTKLAEGYLNYMAIAE